MNLNNEKYMLLSAIGQFFFSSRRRHTRLQGDWSSDVCSSDLHPVFKDKSLLAVAYEYGVPIYTSSPGDSSIGMNVAAKALQGNKLAFDPSLDVNETASIVLAAKRSVHGSKNGRGKKTKGRSGVFILGGGSPKNFMLQTEPQIQEVLGIDERGHDYFLQVTDARPDTGGLSGATPGEAVSWGKVDPDRLPDAVVCYTDSTIALPILAAYALARRKPRKLKRLYDRRQKLLEQLESEYQKARASRDKRAVAAKGK